MILVADARIEFQAFVLGLQEKNRLAQRRFVEVHERLSKKSSGALIALLRGGFESRQLSGEGGRPRPNVFATISREDDDRAVQRRPIEPRTSNEQCQGDTQRRPIEV